jgi:hypothetical protein
MIIILIQVTRQSVGRERFLLVITTRLNLVEPEAVDSLVTQLI